MDRLPLAWRPGLVGAALVLVVLAVARPASVRRTARRAALLAARAGVLAGELVLLAEHRLTRRRRRRGRQPRARLVQLSTLADRRLVRGGRVRRARLGTIPRVRTAVVVALVVATFAPSAAWVATDRWPQNPFARATRSAFSRWNGLEGRLRLGTTADVAAEQVSGPATTALIPPRLSWTLAGVPRPIRFGASADRALAADLDGDGASELVAFAAGTWRIAGWADELTLGQAADVPVPADYDGDRSDEAAVFRPTTGEWLIDGAPSVTTLGARGDVPVPAAYTKVGVAQPAVYRPTTGEWLGVADAPVRFGEAGDVPVPGDYDGDGLAQPAVFRPSTGEWWVLNGPAEAVVWGTDGDVPVPAAWFGASRTIPAVYRPSTGEVLVIGHDPIDVGVTGGEPVVLRRDGAVTVAVVGPPG